MGIPWQDLARDLGDLAIVSVLVASCQHKGKGKRLRKGFGGQL